MSRWSKKDYEMVAAIIASETPYDFTDRLKRMSVKFADTFGNDSEKFNLALFLKACGVTE